MKATPNTPQETWFTRIVRDQGADADHTTAENAMDPFHLGEAGRLEHDVVIEKRHEIVGDATQGEVSLPRQSSPRLRDAVVPKPGRDLDETPVTSEQLFRSGIRTGVDDYDLVGPSPLLLDRLQAARERLRPQVRAHDDRTSAGQFPLAGCVVVCVL
jgi:hypothetical protein